MTARPHLPPRAAPARRARGSRSCLRRKRLHRTSPPACPTIHDLYAIEAEIRSCDPATRLAIRQDSSAPIRTRMDDWPAHHRARASAKSPLGEALAYIARYREGLIRFLDNGALELDTNPVENQIRPIALTRKNALFAGNEIGAENWAMLASLLATCKLSGVNPVDHLADTLRAILDGHPGSRIEDLMPWRYAQQPSSLAA